MGNLATLYNMGPGIAHAATTGALLPQLAQLSSGVDPQNASTPQQVADVINPPNDFLPESFIQEANDPLMAKSKRMLATMSPKYAASSGQIYTPPQQPMAQSPNPSLEDGNLNPAYLAELIKKRESSGNYFAVNPNSSASGAYQYTDGTWNGYGGYARAAFAPPEIQDRRFMQDLSDRLLHYNGDPFKTIAAHYMPALANSPERWNETFKTKSGRTIGSVASYINYVTHGTPLQKSFQVYLNGQR